MRPLVRIGATGSDVQQRSWPDTGLELTLDTADKRGPHAFSAIRAVAPCALRTTCETGLGDTHEAVEAACLADQDPEEEQDELSFVAGSVYSGVTFTFDAKRDKITEIFFGAAAERLRAVMNEMLPCVEVDAKVPATASVIFLHGLGADGHDFEPAVPLFGLPWARFILPHAPSLPVTINGGYVMPAWYDIRSLGFDPHAGPREDEAHIRASAAAITRLIARENARGIASDRIVLGGFSQGGAIALYTGSRHPETLAGLLVLSAYELVADRREEQARANFDTPVLFCHGRHDPLVPMFAGRAAHDAALRPGRDVRWHDYPIQHEVSTAELQLVSGWLHERLPR